MAYTFTRTGAQIEEIHNTVEDPKSNTQFSDDIRTIAGEYRGLWPDTGGSANKGDTYQTQVSGTPTGEYFTALQNTSVDPVGDNVNWKVAGTIGQQNLSDYTDIVYKASGGNSAVENMVAGIPFLIGVGETCECENGTIFKRESDTSGDINDYRALGYVNAGDFGADLTGASDSTIAVQAAIDYAEGLPRPAPVSLSHGTVLLSDTLRFGIKNRFSGGLIGDGINSTTITVSPLVTLDSLISFGAVGITALGFEVKGMRIFGGNNIGAVLDLSRSYRHTISNVEVRGSGSGQPYADCVGILTAGFATVYNDVVVLRCSSGIKFKDGRFDIAGTPFGLQGVHIQNCKLTSNGIGIHFEPSDSDLDSSSINDVHITGNVIETNDSAGIYVRGGGSHLVISGNYFEGNGVGARGSVSMRTEFDDASERPFNGDIAVTYVDKFRPFLNLEINNNSVHQPQGDGTVLVSGVDKLVVNDLYMKENANLPPVCRFVGLISAENYTRIRTRVTPLMNVEPVVVDTTGTLHTIEYTNTNKIGRRYLFNNLTSPLVVSEFTPNLKIFNSNGFLVRYTVPGASDGTGVRVPLPNVTGEYYRVNLKAVAADKYIGVYVDGTLVKEYLNVTTDDAIIYIPYAASSSDVYLKIGNNYTTNANFTDFYVVSAYAPIAPYGMTDTNVY